MNNRFCTHQGHERYPVFHICTLLDCELTTRWCCSKCCVKGVHYHNKANNLHIMDREEILSKVRNELEIIKKDYLSEQSTSQQNLLEVILKECQNLEKSLVDYMKFIENQIQNIISEDDQARFDDYLYSLSHDNFEQLDDEKINQLLSINQYKLNQNRKQQLQQPLDTIIQSLKQMKSIIKDYKDNQNDYINNIIDLEEIQYNIQEIDLTNSYYNASSISKKEQYLAYGGDDKLLKIYDIKQKKIIKEIKLDNFIYVCQFTQDSSQLYVGLREGYVYGYDVYKDFKEIYKQQIHSSYIKRKQQVFKLTGHTDWIIAIDYNDKDEIIVSGSDDQSIKLWNCKNQSIIINKEQSHNECVRQIQLIDNNQNILSLDRDCNLYKWKIDLKNKDLIKLQQFRDQNKIFNFYQVNQDQNLLLICNNHAKILNQQEETINTIQHGGKDSWLIDCRQLDNLKYIQILTKKKIILVTAQV